MKSKIKEMLRPIVMEILAERKKSIPTTPALSTEYLFKNIFGLSEKEAKKTRETIINKVNSTYKTSITEAVKGINLEQPHSNLYIKGWGKDRNGNSTIIVGFPNDKGWAIQTNGTLPETDWTIKRAHKELSEDELDVIGQEITDYVSQYGSKEQKARLKRYNR